MVKSTGIRVMREHAAKALTVFFLLTLGSVQVIGAQNTSQTENQKIEALIKYVSDMSDASFIRNGSSYNCKTAATFLRLKWAANDSSVKTARDFVEKIASVSGTSGKAYLVRFKDGGEVKSRDLLLAALDRIETQIDAQ